MNDVYPPGDGIVNDVFDVDVMKLEVITQLFDHGRLATSRWPSNQQSHWLLAVTALIQTAAKTGISLITPSTVYLKYCTPCLKKTVQIFLSELHHISNNFDYFWQKDGEEAKIMRVARISHFT